MKTAENRLERVSTTQAKSQKLTNFICITENQNQVHTSNLQNTMNESEPAVAITRGEWQEKLGEKRKKNAGNLNTVWISTVERKIDDICPSLVCPAVVSSPHVLPSFPMISRFPQVWILRRGDPNHEIRGCEGIIDSWLKIGGRNRIAGICGVVFHATLRQFRETNRR